MEVRDRKGWRTVAQFVPNSQDELRPILFTKDMFLVRAYRDSDFAAVYRFNLEKNAVQGEPLLKSPLYDIDPSLVTDERKMLGFRVPLDAWQTVWFDPVMNGVQKEIDEKLPGTINQLTPPKRGESPFVLVRASAADEPGRVLVYDRKTKILRELHRDLPELDRKTLSNSVTHDFITRAGRKLPVLVTLPAGGSGKNLPTVVLLGPTPWHRNAFYAWNAEVQFLASRGYAVIQPEARGSLGLGRKHFEAGIRQWGLGMQDDITDSVRWAIERGTADPQRICIAGSTYGYAASFSGRWLWLACSFIIPILNCLNRIKTATTNV